MRRSLDLEVDPCLGVNPKTEKRWCVGNVARVVTLRRMTMCEEKALDPPLTNVAQDFDEEDDLLEMDYEARGMFYASHQRALVMYGLWIQVGH
ncbi:hypothetical protein Mapa_009403 [Marchantia paleacea]|nr:hypothetical protein Mapa_009403 [Marchantia paleacea]